MSNPLLNDRAAENYKYTNFGSGELESMTISGTVLKTGLLFSILAFASYYTFSLVLKGFIDKALMFGKVGLFGGLITVLLICFVRGIRETKLIAPFTMLYAVFEGFVIGGINALFVGQGLSHLVVQAILATFGTLLAVLFLYSARIIRCTEKFRAITLASMVGILIVYLVTWIISLINPSSQSLLMDSGIVGIGFSAFVCVIAAMNLIIDFDVIENAKNMNLSKNFEWYSAFSLMVTLIWLYIEILRLLSKLNSRD